MKLIKKSKVNIDKKVFEETMRLYLSYCKENLPDLNFSELSELYRHSLCSALGVDSKSSNTYIDSLTPDIMAVFMPLFIKHQLVVKPLDFKNGFIEGCIHYMEFSRERAENDGNSI